MYPGYLYLLTIKNLHPKREEYCDFIEKPYVALDRYRHFGCIE